MQRKILAVLVFGCLLLLAPRHVLAKPAPPADLMKIFILFIHGEEYVEENGWDETSKWINDLDRRYRAIKPQIDKGISTQDIAKFENLLADFEAAVKLRNHDRTHEAFFVLNRSFIELLDDFDYRIPPLMHLVQNDLKEALLALKKREVDEIEDELREVEEYFGELIPQLSRFKIARQLIDDFRVKNARARVHAATKDWSMVKALLVEMNKLFKDIDRQVKNN